MGMGTAAERAVESAQRSRRGSLCKTLHIPKKEIYVTLLRSAGPRTIPLLQRKLFALLLMLMVYIVPSDCSRRNLKTATKPENVCKLLAQTPSLIRSQRQRSRPNTNFLPLRDTRQCQTARDEYGPLGDDYNRLEDDLGGSNMKTSAAKTMSWSKWRDFSTSAKMPRKHLKSLADHLMHLI